MAGGTLGNQEAWNLALFMNSHDLSQDPRFVESTEHTRDKLHNENCLHGRTAEELAKRLSKQSAGKPVSNKQLNGLFSAFQRQRIN